MESKEFIEMLVAALTNATEIEDPGDLTPLQDGDRIVTRAGPKAQAVYMLYLKEAHATVGNKCQCRECTWRIHTLYNLFWELCEVQSEEPEGNETCLAIRSNWQIVSFFKENERSFLETLLDTSSSRRH